MSSARLLAANLPATACIVAAAVLAYHGVDGWGWFLAVSLLFGGATVVSRRDSSTPAR